MEVLRIISGQILTASGVWYREVNYDSVGKKMADVACTNPPYVQIWRVDRFKRHLPARRD